MTHHVSQPDPRPGRPPPPPHRLRVVQSGDIDNDVADEELIPAVFAAAAPIVTAARNVYPWPLPRLRSNAFLLAPLSVQQAVLVIAGESYVLGHPAQVQLRRVAREVHGSDSFWRKWAQHWVPYEQLRRIRAESSPRVLPPAAGNRARRTSPQRSHR